MKLIDKYRRRKLLMLRETIKYYEEQLVWANKIENDFNKEDIEDYKEGLYELLAYYNLEACNLMVKLENRLTRNWRKGGKE